MKKTLLILLFFISLLSRKIFSQTAEIDSLINLTKQEQNDSIKFLHLYKLIRLHKKIGEYDKALSYSKSAIKTAIKINNPKSLADVYNTMGTIYLKKSDYTKATEYTYKALKTYEEISHSPGIASSYNTLGLIHSYTENYTKSIEYLLKALQIREDINDMKGQAQTLLNIGIIYFNQKLYDQALNYFTRALETNKKLNRKNGIAICLINIGNVYHQKGDYNNALEYFKKSLTLNQELNRKSSVALLARNIGTLYTKTGKYKKAEKYLNIALQNAKEINSLLNQESAEIALYLLFKKTGNYKRALLHFENAVELSDSIFNSAKQKELMRMEVAYEFEKKQALLKAEQEKKDALAREEKKRQQIIIYATSGISILLIILATVFFRGLKISNKKNKIIETQRIRVERQKKLVEIKNKEITDSLQYAKRIQDAILPEQNIIKKYLKEYFILYQPKDIVAGDFYWFEHIDNKIFFAAADCTGHGVPGAMVSVVCSNALTKCVIEEKITNPGKILDRTRELVIDTLSKNNDVKDGMDISLCVIENNKLEWAGANNPLWLIRNNKDCPELVEIKGDKQAIGIVDTPKPFTTHTLTLQQNDSIYLFTDGFADQFGGPKGKKFKYRPLKELLLSIQDKTMEEQHQILQKTFFTWKGTLEQVDDVCIFGVKIS